ncbi:hypothetical protein IE81DRAFT_115833 [Ceraceosorus guamensis]|uniref:Uncharacterized protein n=1 Tax=Ceraceosorus guamensis TaxID=1522189 RepID=A0A316W200_9BASI|nr:hypothetical protein IE81DRAFT_115833 [Ceraceosorus guamensis]PWN42793.1 hypothetical protein IE81DRAFT_115833 [Ceraceosorus guamensis]
MQSQRESTDRGFSRARGSDRGGDDRGSCIFTMLAHAQLLLLKVPHLSFVYSSFCAAAAAASSLLRVSFQSPKTGGREERDMLAPHMLHDPPYAMWIASASVSESHSCSSLQASLPRSSIYITSAT